MKRLLLLACLGATVGAHGDRRVVDRVVIGDVRMEQEHAYAGDGITAGVADGHAFRQARGWMRYALTVFDDTEVTIACTFLGSGSGPQMVDVMVENHVVASYIFRAVETTTVEFRVPLEITKGRTNILVVLRATNGPTPSLVELRSVQDHNE